MYSSILDGVIHCFFLKSYIKLTTLGLNTVTSSNPLSYSSMLIKELFNFYK